MKQHLIKTDGLSQQVLEAGSGPLVILCHGFPELGFSWRHQVEALAAAGCRAVAPDMRGYGGTDKPAETDDYSIFKIVGDMVDLVRALGETRAVVVGHDWGAPIAWHCALLRPDIFHAVAGLSVPFTPRRANRPPIATFKAIAKAMGKDFYMLRLQAPDAAHEFDADPAEALKRVFWSYDGATPDADRSTGFMEPGGSFLDEVKGAVALPPWMSEMNFATYVEAYAGGGFEGPINWYRNLDRNWALGAFVQDLKITVPALFIVGEKDPVRGYSGSAEAELEQWVPGLRDRLVVPGAGHWIQQERPEAVNAALIGFLKGL